MVKDWNTLQKTGNSAVDMVADHIFYYRRHLKPIKTIKLSPAAYATFSNWVRKNSEEMDRETKFEFDGVDIEKGSALMIKDILVEFYSE